MARTAALALGLLAAVAAPARDAPPAERLVALVERLTPGAVASPEALTRALATNLMEAGGNDNFAVHEARDVRIDGIRVAAVDFRSPRPGGPATAGPLLVLTLDRAVGPCIPERDVRRVFPGLEPDGAPSPHATNPDIYLTRTAGRVRLSFGLPHRGPDCLRTIVYRLDDPP